MGTPDDCRMPTIVEEAMAQLVLLRTALTAAFGFSMLPLLIPAAFAMCALSFRLTRDKRMIYLGTGFGIVLLCHFIVQFVKSWPGNLKIPAWAIWLASESVLEAISALVIVVALYLGVRGTLRGEPPVTDRETKRKRS